MIDQTIAFTILGLLGFVMLTQSQTKENFVGGLPNFTTKAVNSGYTVPSRVAPRFTTHDQGQIGRGDSRPRGSMMYNKGKLSSMPSGGNAMDDRTLDVGPLMQGYPMKEGFVGDIHSTGLEVSNILPTMGVGAGSTLNAQGAPIVFDRLIFANQKSRLAAQGDPIRGDLAIVPLNNEWMRPSVRPNIDLRDGAMAIMGGWDNSTSRETLKLRMDSSHGSDTMGGGVDVSVARRQALMNGQRDIIM